MRNVDRNNSGKLPAKFRGSLRNALFGRRALLLAATVTVAGIAQPLFAKGRNRVVVDRVANGSASFANRGNNMIIRASDRAIINYKRFDIPRGASVRFIQPSATSRLLNRINSESPSMINGKLSANGIVYFVNPSGVIFGQGSVVNATQIFAAAGGLTDDNFLAGIDHFTGLQGRVINFGTVHADSVTFVGELVANHGTIVGRDGVVVLASGDDVLVGREDGNIFVRVDTAPAPAAAPAAPAGAPAGRISSGLGAGDVYSLAVRNSGHIRASQVKIDAGQGTAAISGRIDASNRADGQTGGSVEILGDTVSVSRANISASGHSGGGAILIGGDVQGTGDVPTSENTLVSRGSRISADALATGNGGKIIVFAEDTAAVHGHLSARGGRISGNGGFVETSGKQSIQITTTPDVTAKNGTAGEWLIDPNNVALVPGGALVNADGTFTSLDDGASIGIDLIIAALNGGATVTVTTGAAGTNLEAGDITLSTNLDYDGTGNGTLNLIAHNDITIAGQILDSDLGTADSLNLNLTANSDNALGGSIFITQPVNLGTGNLVTNANAVAANIGAAVTSANQTYNGPVALAADGNLDAGAGTVTFANTLNLADFNLTITAAQVDFNGGANSVSGGGGVSAVVLQPNLAATPINVGITADAGALSFDLTDAHIAALDDGIASLTIGRADGQHAIEITSATFVDPTTIRTPSGGSLRVAADPAVDGLIGADNASITLNAPSIQLADNVTTNNSAQTFTGPVTLQANTTIDAGTAAVTFSSTIDGAFDLIVNSGAATTFGNAIDIASLTTNATGTTVLNGNVTTTANQAYNDAVTLGAPASLDAGAGTITFATTLGLGGFDLSLTASEVEFNGGANSVSGGGGTSDLTLQPNLAATPINVGFAADAGAASFDVTDTKLAAFADALASLTIGRANGTHAIEIESAVFVDPAIIQSPSGGFIHVALDGAADGITGTGNASIILDSPDIRLQDNVTTNNANQTYNGPVTLQANVTLSSGSGNVTFADTIDGAFALAVNSSGITTFNGDVDVQSLATDLGGTTALNAASFTTTASQTHNDNVTLGADAVLDASSGNITFGGTVTGAFTLTANSTGTTAFGNSVNIAGLTTNAGGTTVIQGPNVTTTAAQTFNDPLTLFGSTIFSAGAANVTFNGAVSGAFSLSVNTTGVTTFGNTVNTASLTTNPGGSTAVNGGAITTTGGQLFNDAVTLGADATFDGASLTFASTVTGPFSFTISSAGAATFANTVNVATVTSSTLGALAINGGAVTTTGNQLYNDAVTLGADAVLNAGAGDITFANTLSGAFALTANSTGTTTFANTVNIGSLTTNAGGTTAVNGGLVTTTTGDQVFNDPVTLAANTTLDANAFNITFNSTVTGAAFDLTANSTGTTTFNDAVTVDSLTTNAGGSTVLNGTTFTTVTGQTHNDAVTLASDTTLDAGAGDITFASTVGGVFSLTANSTGTTAFNNTVNIASLTTNAGGATTLAGGAVTTSGDQIYNDAVTVTANTTLSGANVTFGSTVTGAANALTVNSPGATTFNNTVTVSSLTTDAPGSTALNGGTVTTAAGQTHNDPVTLGADTTLNAGAGNITFGGSVTGAAFDLTANSTGATAFGGPVTLDGLTTDAGGSTAINGGSVITTGNQSYNDPVSLGALADLLASAGNISFGNTLDLNGFDLTLTAIQIDLGTAISDGQGTSDVVIQPVDPLAAINIGFTDGNPLTLQISDTDLAALAAGLASLTVGRSNGQHAIEVQSINLLNDTTIRSPLGGSIHNQAVAGDGIISTGSVTLQAPSILLEDNVTTTNANQTYDGAVTLQADVAASAGTGNIDFNATVGGNFNLVVNSLGTTTFDAAVNLGSLTTDAGGTTLLNGGSFTTQTGHTHNDATVLGADATLDASSGDITFADTLTGLFDLIANSTANTTFGGPVSIDSLITSAGGTTLLNGAAFTTSNGQIHNDPVTLGADTVVDANAGAVTFAQTLTAPAFDLTVNSTAVTTFGGTTTLDSLTTNAGGTTALNGGIVTTVSGQTHNDNVTLGANTNLNAGAGNITFAQFLTGIPFDLGANSSGTTTFGGPVSVDTLFTDALGTTALDGGTFITTGGQTHLDPVTLSADATLNAGAGDIVFDQTVTGASADLIANSSGTTILNGPATLQSILTNLGGTTILNGGTYTTTAGHVHGDDVTLGLDTTLDAGAGNIAFAQTLTGAAFDLLANSTATTTFGGATTLDSLTTNAGGTTALDGGSFTTVNGQVHNDDVTAAADATLNAGAGVITFAQTITGPAADFIANSSNTTTFNGAVTLASLTTDAAGDTAINGGAVTTTAGQTHNDPVTLGADATLNASSGDITFAQTVTGAAADLNANSTGTTTFGGTVTLASLRTNAGGTTAINGGTVTTTAGQTHDDDVTLGAATTLNANTGNIFFGQSLTSASSLLANSSGFTTFNGPVTLDSLTTDAGGSTNLEGGIFTTVNGQVHNDDVSMGADATLNAGAGVITFEQTVNGGTSDLIANSSNTTTFNGPVNLASLTTDAGGTTALNGVSFLTTAGQIHNDNTTLGADTTLNASGGVITFAQTLIGAGFDLLANSTSTTTFGGAVTVDSITTDAGGTTALNGGSFTTVNGQIHNDAVTVGADATLDAGAGVITFAQSVTGASADLTANSTALTTFDGAVTLDSLATNTGGTTALNGGTFTTVSGQTHHDAVTVGNDATLNAGAGDVTFDLTVTGASADMVANSSGTTTFSDAVTLQSLRTDLGGTTALDGGTFTTTAGQTHDDNVTLGAPATLNASAGDITFNQTISGAGSSLTANSTGDTRFNGAVTVQSLTTNAGGSTALSGGTVTTTAGQTHNDAVTLGANATLAAGAGDITFADTLTGAGSTLAANSTGATTFDGAVEVQSLTTNAGGTTAINGGSVTTTAGQIHNDAVTLGADTTLTANAGNVTFASTLTGAASTLAANSSGATTFGGAVTLESLTTDAAGTAILGGGTFTTTAGHAHNDPVTLASSSLLNASAGNVTFAQTVTSPTMTAGLTVNSTGATRFDGTVAANNITTNAGGTTALNGGTFTTINGQAHNDNVALGAHTTLNAGSGNVSFGANLTSPGRASRLTANSSGATTFGGPVSVNSLTTNAGGTTALNGGLFTTTTGQTHNDNVTLGADAVVTVISGDIHFDRTVNGARDLDLNAAAGKITIAGDAGNTNRLTSFDADARQIDIAGINASGDITITPDATATPSAGAPNPGLLVIRNSVTSQGGAISLSPDTLGAIPANATIVAAPGGGQTLLISSPGGSIELGVHQKFSVRQDPNSGDNNPVNLTVQADTVTLGDINVEGDLVVEANTINLIRRAQTPGSADQGIDFVAGGGIRFDGDVNLIGTGAQPVFGSGTGFGEGAAAQFLFIKVGDVTGRLRDNAALAATPDLTPLAADLLDSVNVPLATAIAGAVPRDIPRPQQEAGVSAALRDDLLRMGVNPKDLTVLGIWEALSGRSLYEDLPKRLNPDFRDIQVTTDRLYYRMSMEVIQAYRAIYAPRYFNAKTGQIEVRNNVEHVKGVLRDAVQGYASANPNIEEVNGNDLRLYIEAQGSAEAKKLLVDLRDMFEKLERLGLTETEQRVAERKLLGDILPEDLTAAQLRVAIMGASESAPATKPAQPEK